MPSSSQKAAKPTPWRRLILLIVLIFALVAGLLAGSLATDKSRWLPDFALDLEGGTQVILTPTTTDGSEVTQNDVSQAIEIIRQRVDASGVAEAEITSQGGSNIVVGLPGTPSKETLDLVRTSAVLRMRAVIQIADTGVLTREVYEQQQAAVEGSEGEDAPSEGSSEPFTEDELHDAAMEIADADGDGELSSEPATEPTSGSDMAWVTEQVTYDALTINCAEATTSRGEDDPDTSLVACDPTTGVKYIVGPAEIEGTQITQASSGFDQQRNEWIVSMEFNSEGADSFADITGRLAGLDSPQNQFAIVLDGQVVSAPSNERPIPDGRAQISGPGLNAETTKTLANQLNFGSLPLHFEVQSEEQISATLGSDSLESGLIAGLIGLVLVVLYLLWQYHGLGVVASGSVLLATATSYLLVCLLSWVMGYRLSMAGVVGLIISIGVTADSFIVFFERIRDEIREGRPLKSAVYHGWNRAKRTIIVADMVNLACAVVLYFLAVGSVRGFAFTLGLTTVIDLVIVMMFTYPLMTLLTRTKFFGEGRKFSGLDAAALGREPSYRGAGRTSRASRATKKEPVAVGDSSAERAGSLAERRARDRRAKRDAEGDDL
ncbi:MAG: protein translocase subunit SecD [Ancrocorticia sp.]|uniref:protein translocase subunit SecD n=1 Tax=Ancrocorticia sp. TaxID=2593684 RepID=UPI003F90B8B7